MIALVPSCALMLKFEWPLIVPDDDNVKTLSGATADITEYIVDIAKREGLPKGLVPWMVASRCTSRVTRGPRTWARKALKCYV